MYCWKCGKQIPEGSRFCPACGSAVKGAAQPQSGQPMPAQPAAQTPVQPGYRNYAAAGTPQAGPAGFQSQPQLAQPARSNPVSPNPPKKKSKKGLIITLCALAAVVCAVVVLLVTGVLSFGKKNDKSGDANPFKSDIICASTRLSLSNEYYNYSYRPFLYDPQSSRYEMLIEDDMAVRQLYFVSDRSYVFVKQEADGQNGIYSLRMFDGKDTVTLKEYTTGTELVILMPSSTDRREIMILSVEETDRNEWVNLESLDVMSKQITSVSKREIDVDSVSGVAVTPDGKRVVLSECTEEQTNRLILHCYSKDAQPRILGEVVIGDEQDEMRAIFCDDQENVILKNEDRLYVFLKKTGELLDLECILDGEVSPDTVITNYACNEFIFNCEDGLYSYAMGDRSAKWLCKSGDYLEVVYGGYVEAEYYLNRSLERSSVSSYASRMAALDGACFVVEEDGGYTFYKIKSVPQGSITKLVEVEMNEWFWWEASQDGSKIVYCHDHGLCVIDVEKETSREVFRPMFSIRICRTNSDMTKSILVDSSGSSAVIVDLATGQAGKSVEIAAEFQDFRSIASVKNKKFEGIVYISGGKLMELDYDGVGHEMLVTVELQEMLREFTLMDIFRSGDQTFITLENRDERIRRTYVINDENEVVKVNEMPVLN